MIILRMFWALFLAGMVAYTFNRSWRWEHREPMPETLFGSDKPRTKETIVWLDPSFLPVLLLIILIMFRSIYGSEGVDRFMSLSLDVMILISFYFILLIFLNDRARSAPEPARHRRKRHKAACHGRHQHKQNSQINDRVQRKNASDQRQQFH